MIWLILALVIVLVVAVLLAWILSEARGIRVAALRALRAAEVVEERTKVLWKIPELNQLLDTGYGLVASIAGKARQAADAVDPQRGKT
ncbi:MAG: hypothetical protein ACOYW9_05285 [Deinococcota bacterium]